MRILHTESSQGWGGQEIRVLRESQKLVERGHEVFLLCNPESSIACHASVYAPGVSLVSVGLRKKRLPELLNARHALLKLCPDIVVCHSSTDHWLVALARLTTSRDIALARARHISTPIGTDTVTRWLYSRGCELILTTGAGIRESMIAAGFGSSEKIHSIPTGVRGATFGMLSKREARGLLSLPVEKVFVGIVATLRSWKGHDDLLQAFSIMREGIDLLIVGDGPRFQALTEMVSRLGLVDRVHFVGRQETVAPWLSALDVYVQPSYANEGVPQSILQAMATGLPIVSCPVGGIPEALTDYGAACLVPPRSVPALRGALEQMIEGLTSLPARDHLKMVKYTEDDMAIECELVYERTVHDLRYR